MARRLGGRQSLVTPIDWKRRISNRSFLSVDRRQSLVTPIDWKQDARDVVLSARLESDANLW